MRRDAPPTSIDTLEALAQATRQGFEQSMDDDFNSAGALGYLFEFVRGINQVRADGGTDAQLSSAQTLLTQLTRVLGLRLEDKPASNQAVEPFIDLLLELRLELRKQKMYALSDMVRDRLTALGIILEDGKGGTSWRMG